MGLGIDWGFRSLDGYLFQAPGSHSFVRGINMAAVHASAGVAGNVSDLPASCRLTNARHVEIHLPVGALSNPLLLVPPLP